MVSWRIRKKASDQLYDLLEHTATMHRHQKGDSGYQPTWARILYLNAFQSLQDERYEFRSDARRHVLSGYSIDKYSHHMAVK